MLLHGSYDLILITTLDVNMLSPHFTEVKMETQRRFWKSAKIIQCSMALLSALESEATIENKGVIPLCDTNLSFGKLAYS